MSMGENYERNMTIIPSNISRFSRGTIAQKGAQDGVILAVPVRMADRREYSNRKIVLQCCDQTRWVYTRASSRSKREFRLTC
jgi:hypothetical protein